MSTPDKSETRILVVDDEPVVLSLVEDTLEDRNCLVKTASGGEEALRKITSEEFDILITDIRMPHMTGTELVQRAREIAPDISVIFMTGYANLTSAKKAVSQSAVEYITKPFEIAEMRQAVDKAVRLREEAAGSNSTNQLARLSDLHEILLTTGDKKSLLFVSLRFAMMHCHADKGSILRWNPDCSDIRLISIHGEQVVENEIANEGLDALIGSFDFDKHREPALAIGLKDHAFLAHTANISTLQEQLHQFHGSDSQLAVLPVGRTNAYYGVMFIHLGDASASVAATSLKFLSLAAKQLAISLENLDLLDDAQQAYAKLEALQDETIQLEKMATRGEMSAEIGHELNNFLAVVAGNLSLLDVQLRKENYSDLGRYVKATLDTVEQIKKFTSNLMDLTPIASTKEVIVFNQLLSEVIDYLKPQKRFRGVTIDYSCKVDNILFHADVTHIQQLLYNLFNNAADSMIDSDTKTISATIVSIPDQQQFKVTISDTGCGIEQELIEKAFNVRFTTKKTGHGYGLVVCKRVIDNHGGNLRIESVPGKGTSISIEFPMAEATSPIPEPSSA